MGRRTIPALALGALAVLVAVASAGPTGVCGYTRAQAKRALARSPDKAALVGRAMRCHGQPPVEAVLIDSRDRRVMIALAHYAVERQGPVVKLAAQRSKPPAHPAPPGACWHADLLSVNRVYLHGEHVMSITKTLRGWCWNGHVVLRTQGWGHAIWSRGPWCVAHANNWQQHAPDGHFRGKHWEWAHGGAFGYLGGPGGAPWPKGGIGSGCWPVSQHLYPAVIRVAGNGYWDTFNDFHYRRPQG